MLSSAQTEFEIPHRPQPVPPPLQPRPVEDPTLKVVSSLRRARSGLEQFLPVFPQLEPGIRGLHRIERRLTRPLRIAIAGEFNSGKSSLTNLLVGIESLPTAIISNTRIPTLMYYAERPEIYAVDFDGNRTAVDLQCAMDFAEAFRLEVGLPSPMLTAAQFIDLPGVGDPRFDDAAAEIAPHGVDAVLWCTVATQAWKESERMAWTSIPSRLLDRSLLVVTHRDLIRDAQDEAKLMARLRDVAGSEFQEIVMLSTATGAEPALIAVPADRAEAAAHASDIEALRGAIDRLIDTVRLARANEAMAVTNRIAERSLMRIG